MKFSLKFIFVPSPVDSNSALEIAAFARINFFSQNNSLWPRSSTSASSRKWKRWCIQSKSNFKIYKMVKVSIQNFACPYNSTLMAEIYLIYWQILLMMITLINDFSDFFLREINEQETLHSRCKRTFNYVGKQSSLLDLETLPSVKVAYIFTWSTLLKRIFNLILKLDHHLSA